MGRAPVAILAGRKIAAVAMKVKHFKTAAQFRAWLAKHHAGTRELWVGYYRKESGKGGMTWSESVDEALCYGWIDGIRKKIDDVSYTNRFTPRQPRSTWSAINIRRAQELIDLGRMRAPGRGLLWERAARSFNGQCWVRGKTLTPHPTERVAQSALPSPTRGEGMRW